jgi:hypothetical protein
VPSPAGLGFHRVTAVQETKVDVSRQRRTFSHTLYPQASEAQWCVLKLH